MYSQRLGYSHQPEEETRLKEFYPSNNQNFNVGSLIIYTFGDEIVRQW